MAEQLSQLTQIAATTSQSGASFKNHGLPSYIYSAKHVIGASSAAFCSVLVGFPFDSLKTRMQAYDYLSMNDCIRKTYAKEGLIGFFRGCGPPLVTVAAVKSISFSIYTSTKARLSATTQWNTDTSVSALVAISTAAGTTAGVGVSVLSCPLELVKIQRQLERLVLASSAATTRSKTKSSFRVASDIIRAKGVVGLYRGISLHLLRDSVGTGIYFSSYESAKRLLTPSDKKPGPLTHLLSGAASGITSWLVIFPVDMVKTRVQKQILLETTGSESKVVDIVKTIFAREGLRGFYNGFTATLFRAVPIHSINWIVYEQVVKLIEQNR
ncbi:hypothetical protein SmJEL517_g01175 [Synchytrium microbalum]|uniref:Mitochondrial carrier protein n=1 Tax=Synchytrium microbalum TaxID=1806994 RepID=A0A507CAG6_9FUNG|nr:uncharacterized protein SmJEL517_g01175 [Synchytrium microbalum]TPX36602.1 hypothetical protein SmJEL517_g01175 [Synchytrium microbalum]